MIEFSIPEKPKKLRRKATPPRKTPYAVIPTRALTDKWMTDRNRTVLAILSSFASRAGITWVSQGRLAQELGVTRQAVNQQMQKLIRNGYVEKVGNSKTGKPGIAGCTWRVVYDPTLNADDAIAIAGNGMDTDMPEPHIDPVLQEENMQNFIHNGPRSLGDILKEMPMKQRKVKEKAVAEERKTVMAQDYTREFSQTVRQVCGVERVANEQDFQIANEFAQAGVPLHLFKAALLESLQWHRDTGKQPPAGLGYYRAAALTLAQG